MSQSIQRNEINDFIKKHWNELSDQEIANKCGININAVEHRRRRLGLRRDSAAKPLDAVQYETDKLHEQKEKKDTKATVKSLVEEVDRLKRELDAAYSQKTPIETHAILPTNPVGGEATLIALASDWHIEEEVRPAQVNDLNVYNLKIASKRADSYFATLRKLVEIEAQNTQIDHLVLALLGDFITNDIHEELVETAELEPMVAMRRAQEMIVSGIEYLLANSKLKLTIVCHSGNHARSTKDQRHATEHGHSIEWFAYKAIEDRYVGNPRVTMIVPESYHSYVDVYDWTIRFHHGHAINYGGGVGGITIPVRKAIAQWNTLRRADIDCFGHFHQAFDGGNFIANGSMIGYNAYALSIKAAFEEPVQMLFGIHKKLGKYFTRSIKFV